MKFAVLAASVATLAPLASAAGYQAAWTIVGDKCDGQISLGEYTATPAECKAKDCGAIPGVTKYSTKTTCAETHTGAAETVLGANKKPYVLVEVYKSGSECSGAFDIAIGVTADGECYPGTNGKASYNVSWTLEKGTVWLQYDDAECKGKETKVEFPPTAADGKVCTAGFLKALAVAPSAESTEAGSNSSNSSEPTVTMAPGATTMMPSGTTATPSGNNSSGNASAATPAPTTSAASTTFVSAAIATFAVAAAALA